MTPAIIVKNCEREQRSIEKEEENKDEINCYNVKKESQHNLKG
jgi:hypothetical protein